MNLSIKYGKGYYNVAIEKNHHQLFSKTVKDLNEIITNEVVEELLKNKAVTLKVNHLLVLSISDQYPIIAKQEIRKFHQQKADELLGFHSPMFNVAFSKRHRGITINSFHLKEEVLSFLKETISQRKGNINEHHFFGKIFNKDLIISSSEINS